MAREYLENLGKERTDYTRVLSIGCSEIEGKTCIAYFLFRYLFHFNKGYVYVARTHAASYCIQLKQVST